MVSSETTATREGGSAEGAGPRGGPLSGGLGVFVVVILLGVAGYSFYQTFTSPPKAERLPLPRDFICAATMKHFSYEMHEGERAPVYSPYSKQNTGWPAEKCFWTKEGEAKLTPTYVLLNEYLKKSGPTICPDCGRLVEPHNPLPPMEKLQAALERAATRTAAPSAGG